MIFKNVAGQGIYLFARDTGATPVIGKTGDAANISVNLSKDGGATAAATNSVSEIGGGFYWLALTQAETNAKAIAVIASSVTANIVVDGKEIYTEAGEIATIKTHLTDIKGATWASTDSLEAIRDRGDAAWVTGSATGANQTTIIGHLTDIKGVGWSSSYALDQMASVADLNAEVDTALQDIGLDHLLSIAVTGADVIDNSIFAKLASKSATADWDDFVNTTDSLQAVRDRGDAAWVTATGFSTHSAADVWSAVTRTLTAASNITSDGAAINATAGVVDTVSALTGHTPQTGDSYAVLASGIAGRSNNNTLNALLGVTDAAGKTLWSGGYWAMIDFRRDTVNDEYTVCWFEKDQLVQYSALTSPQIRVIRRSDGTDLVPVANLTRIGTTDYLKKDESTNRITVKESFVVVLTATIGGSPRTWSTVLGRDS